MFHFTLIALCSGLVLAQSTFPFPSDLEVLTQQGNLFAVRVVSGRPIQIFVVGRQEAELDFSGVKLGLDFEPADFSLHIRRLDKNKKSRILRWRRERDHFVIDDPEAQIADITLEVTAQAQDQKDVFKFKLKNKLP